MTKQKTIVHLIGNTTTPSKYPIASEYIKPMGQINITSHGLGSGIYGLSIFKYKSITHNLPAYLSDHKFVKVKIMNPFILSSNERCDKLINWSTQLNDTLEKYKEKFLSGKLSLHLISSIYTTHFNKISSKKITKKKFRNGLRKFFLDYVESKDFVGMPINYILKELKHDGIYAEGTACDSMNKGNIKFMWYSNKNKKKILTNVIKIRNGTNIKKIRIPNYMLVNGMLIKHPPRFTPEYEKWKKSHGIQSYRVRRIQSRKNKK